MRVPNRVIWSEGMFMSPQHLQQLDRYHEGFVNARIGSLLPYDWGVIAVELDERALVAGQVRVHRFEGVLPDGLPLAFDAAHSEVPAIRPIEGHFPAAQRVLEIFLAVPAEREGLPAIAPANTPTPGLRFFTSARPVVDAAGGATDVNVAFAQRHVTVLFGDESRDDYEAIKVAEIVRAPDGSFALRQEFIPPCRRIAASAWLMNRLRQVLALMAAVQRSLMEGRRQRDASTIEFREGDVGDYLKLNAVNTFYPIVNHLIERSETPPDEAYLLLSQFAGQLSTFAPDGDPTKLPKFFYTDLVTTFGDLLGEITRLLNLVNKARFITVPLESREDGLHFGRLEDDRLLRAEPFVLTIRSNQPDRVAAEQIPSLCKIASWGDIGSIVQVAIPGVPVQVTYRPPSEIPSKAGVLYFVLSQSGQYWRNILSERTIAIYLPAPYDPSSIKIELLAIPKVAAAQ